MSYSKGKGLIPSSLVSLLLIVMVMIYIEFASCNPMGPPQQDVSSGSHSDSHSGDGSWSFSWSNPDSGKPNSRQKRFCLLIFWLCTGGGGGSGGYGGGSPGAPGGRI